MTETDSLSSSEETPDLSQPRRAWLKSFPWKSSLAAILVIAIITAPFGYRYYLLSGIPDIGDPFDVAAFGTVNILDADNARSDYETALRLLVNGGSSSKFAYEELETAFEDWHSATPELRRWLESNQASLRQWKLGTEKPDFQLHQPRDVHINTRLDLNQALRGFARLALLEASRQLAEGDPQAAWEWCRAILRSSRHSGQHGGAIERLVGIAMHTMTLPMLLRISQHPATSEELLNAMLAEIKTIDKMTPAHSKSLKFEYLMLKNSIHNPQMMDEFLRIDLSYKSVKDFHYHAYRFLGIEPRLSQLATQQYFANLLDQIDLPVHEQQQPRVTRFHLFQRDPKKSYGDEYLLPAQIEEQIMKSVLARSLISPKCLIEIASLRERTKQHSLELCLALRIYFLRHNKYPEKLDDLITAGIIDEVPIDPYSPTGDKMRYQLVGDDAFIWGVGENTIDDGGMEIDSDIGSRQQLDIGLVLRKHPKDDSVEAKKP